MPLPVGLWAAAKGLAILKAKQAGKRLVMQRGLPAAGAAVGAVAVGAGIRGAARRPSPFAPQQRPGPPRGPRGEEDRPAKWYKKDGTPRRIRKDGRPWDIPSLDVSNTAAMRRALRRVEGFRKIVKRVEAILPGRQFTRKKR